jgi:hypothetical protein
MLEEGNEPQRCAITPVQIVDRDQQRTVRRDVRGQPEQAI